jgi:hypothetical protein
MRRGVSARAHHELVVFGAARTVGWAVRNAPALSAALLVLMASVSSALAAEIESDRPELTESAKLVPRGAVQLETGLEYSRERQAGQPTEKTFGIGGDLRIGLGRDVELNVGWQPLVRVRGSQDDTGVGDVTLGVRYRFVEGFEDVLWPPHIAVKVFTKLPGAGEPIGTGRPDFGALLLASLELPYDFELEVNLGAAAIGQTRPNGYLAQGIATASLSRDLTSSLVGFLELLFTTRDERGTRGQFAVNAGLVHRLTSSFAIDAGVQTSLVGQGADVVVRTGVSVLWR